MKVIPILLTILAMSTAALSQSCLPEGIIFTTQSQVDNFSINYPGCTEIQGSVKFSGYNINNLNGLSVLTHIGGNLECYYLDLDNFEGLNNLDVIGDTLLLYSCTISSFSGLNGLDTIGGALIFQGCYLPSSMEGLENLISIGGLFDLSGNYGLTDLTGINNLTAVGGGLKIVQNRWLENLAALASLAEINGDLIIVFDSSLVSLDGLENIDPNTIADIAIYDNYMLSECGIESICNYLQSPNGVVDIYNNSGGCNTPVLIAGQCSITLPCLPYGNYYFHSQADVNNFPVDYPECLDLGGDIVIKGSDIINLQGLEQVTSISGNLSIIENASLISLTGLDNLDTVGGALLIHINPALPDLSGLQNLESVGEGLFINDNEKLNSIGQLSNLLSINGYLYLMGNLIIATLTGLDHIDPQSISNIIIIDNNLLSECEVQSICDYLADPVGEVTVWGNNTGCDSPEEILDACNVGLYDPVDLTFSFLLYPNPTSDVLYIEAEEEIERVTIFNNKGITLEQWNNGTMEQTNRRTDEQTIDNILVVPVKDLAPGLYLARVETRSGVVARKVIVGK